MALVELYRGADQAVVMPGKDPVSTSLSRARTKDVNAVAKPRHDDKGSHATPPTHHVPVATPAFICDFYATADAMTSTLYAQRHCLRTRVIA